MSRRSGVLTRRRETARFLESGAGAPVPQGLPTRMKAHGGPASYPYRHARSASTSVVAKQILRACFYSSVALKLRTIFRKFSESIRESFEKFDPRSRQMQSEGGSIFSRRVVKTLERRGGDVRQKDGGNASGWVDEIVGNSPKGSADILSATLRRPDTSRRPSRETRRRLGVASRRPVALRSAESLNSGARATFARHANSYE